jgi:hypothetical protein
VFDPPLDRGRFDRESHPCTGWEASILGRTARASLRDGVAGKAIRRAVHCARGLAAIPALAVVLALMGCGDSVTATPAPESQSDSRGSPAVSPARRPEMAAASRSTGNSAPRIWSLTFEPEKPVADDRVRVRVETDDADEDPLFFEYRWELDGEVLEEDSDALALRGAARGSVLAVTVTASDGVATSAARRSEVVLGNRPPSVERLAIRPAKNIVAGMTLRAEAFASDPEGDALELRYEWRVNGKPSGEAGEVFDTAGLKRGDTLSVAVVASDAVTPSAPVASPDLLIVNAPPRIVSKPGQPSDDGVFRYRVAAEDPDGDSKLEYHLLDAPDGMEIDTLSGSIIWQPQPDQLGTRLVSVVVDDPQGGRGEQSFEVSVDGR